MGLAYNRFVSYLIFLFYNWGFAPDPSSFVDTKNQKDCIFYTLKLYITKNHIHITL